MVDKTLDKINTFVPEKWRWVLQHGGFRKYFKNTGWMFLGQMASLVVSFFVGVWIARYLGPDNYGNFNYAIAYAGLFSFIASLGIDGILSRDLVANPEKRDELLGTAFLLKLIGGLLSIFLILISFLFFKHPVLVKALIVLYSFIFILQPFNIISIFFQSNVQAKNNVRSQLIALAISSILKIVLIIFNKGIIFLTVIYLLDSLWLSLGLFSSYKKNNLKIINWKFKFSMAKEMLSSSWLLILSAASSFVLTRIDQIMIGHFLGNISVGIYSAAVRLAEVWYFIPGLICSSLFPAIVNSKKTNFLVYKKRLKFLYLLMIFISVAIATPLSVFSFDIINFLFGNEYIGAVPVLKIYVWSGVGLFVSWVYYYYLLSENKLKKIFYFYFILMICNLLLNYFLIKKIGVLGASISTLISYLIIPFIFISIDFYNLKKKKYAKII